jgi:ATP-dependent DNA helicase RecG
MDNEKLLEVISALREEGSDNQYYEAKAAAKGMPQNIRTTISAFANTPGGGVLILGVDENSGFDIVGVYDAKQCQQTLANYARKEFSALVSVKSSLVAVGDKKIVWAHIEEADRTLKPIKIKNGSRSYIRLYDGDYELSEQEEQLFIANRGPSHFDEDTIPGSTVADLDEELTVRYIANRRIHSQALSRMDDSEVLFRTGVTNRVGELTRAGAAALGAYPQQFMPNYSIKVSVQKKNGFAENVRAVNISSIDGPIPLMLDETVKWVANNTNEFTLDLPNGHVRNVKEYPPAAIRELVSNSLIHRDINPLSMFQSITLTIKDDRLIISNPGGLYGLSVKELGHTESRTRNTRLAEICQYVTDRNERNVIEKLGSGIPKVREVLSSANMPPPTFIDGGIYFSVLLKSTINGTADRKRTSLPILSDREARILAALGKNALSKKELSSETALTMAQTRYVLKKLIRAGKVRKVGEGSSPATKYALSKVTRRTD